MTKTEQFHAAWEILKSKKDILKMFEEVEASSDEIDKVEERLLTVKLEHEAKRKEADLEKICQMCVLRNITGEELVEYMTRPRASNGSRRHEHTYKIMAYVKGRPISKFGRLPKWAAEEFGWSHQNDVPEEYWTHEHREHTAAQEAIL